jgi:hypothetical protein
MTQPEKLQHIREKCIAANPEIVELKFGCLVDLYAGESAGLAHVVAEIGICRKHKTVRGCERSNDFSCDPDDGVMLVAEHGGRNLHLRQKKTAEIEKHKILGRPIRLADIYVAYLGNGKPSETIVDVNNHLSKELKIMTLWNLRADDLEKQSEETINFLYELLR